MNGFCCSLLNGKLPNCCYLNSMPRSSLLLALGLLLGSVANAQEFGRFRLGIGLGFVAGNSHSSGTTPSPQPSTSGTGFSITFEPAHMLNPNFRIGMRWETAFYGTTKTFYGKELGPMGSISLNGQYYFAQKKVRPFVGAGIGVFYAQNNFGFYPRVGFEARQIEVALECNLVPACLTNYDSVTTTYLSSGAYYFGLRVSWFFRWSKISSKWG